MWFDARAKLAEILAHTPATTASTATIPGNSAPGVAEVATVAAPHRFKSNVSPMKEAKGPRHLPQPPKPLPREAFHHGTACGLGDMPRTWAGRVVSLADWRNLTDWERHGPRGRHWNGLTRQWEAFP
jgi:hypothetical protein